MVKEIDLNCNEVTILPFSIFTSFTYPSHYFRYSSSLTSTFSILPTYIVWKSRWG